MATLSNHTPAQGLALPGKRLDFAADQPLQLDSGISFGPFSLAYQTYGTLNSDRSNAVLICHALTGDHFVADQHPLTGKPGWWTTLVGPGKPIDTQRFFVICSNVLGGCLGTTGPSDIDPATGQPYGLGFPVITIGDMVRAQARLIDHLGIQQLFAVVGGSMGAMQVLQWAVSYPDRVFAAIPIAGAARHSAQNIAFHEVGRQAIMADPDWRRVPKASIPAVACRSPAWRPISPICRKLPCIASSAATCRTGPQSPMVSMPIFRSRAICAIRD